MDEGKMAQLRLQMERLRTFITTNQFWVGASRSEKNTIRHQAKHYVLEGDNIFFMDKEGHKKEVITNLERVREIIHMAHSSGGQCHSGIEATTRKISRDFIWGSIKADVREYITACAPCQKYDKVKTQAPLLKPIKTSQPLELVGMDLITMTETARGSKYILTMVDYFTKFVDLFALKTKDAESVCTAVRSFIYRWGPPQRFLTDRGREFDNKKLNELLHKEFNARHSTSSAYHPQTNGLVERMNSTVQTRLSKLKEEHQTDWDEFLESVAFSLRTQRQASTKFSPYFMMFGREPRMPYQMNANTEEDIPEVMDIPEQDQENYIQERDKRLLDTYKVASENQDRAHNKQQEQFAKRTSKGVKTFIMQPGDLVLKKNARKVGRKGGASDPDWTGPYRIVDIDDNQRVALASQRKDGRQLTTRVAYEHIKPFKENINVPNNNVQHSVNYSNDDVLLVSGEGSLKIQQEPQGAAGNADKQKPVVSALSLLAEAASVIGNKEKLNKLLCDDFSNDDDDFVLGFPMKRKAACLDNGDDVFFAQEFGPKRRHAKPLPVIPAERQNHSIQEMQAILSAKRELCDLHIDHFSAMLREQFPHVGGLQRLGIFESLECQRVGTPMMRFVQVLHVGRHWVTVSNLHCSVAEVMVYDSLYTEIRKEHKHKFLKQLGWQLHAYYKIVKA